MTPCNAHVFLLKAVKNKDLGAAAEVFGKETISVLIKTLEPTQPEAALALKVAKVTTESFEKNRARPVKT